MRSGWIIRVNDGNGYDYFLHSNEDGYYLGYWYEKEVHIFKTKEEASKRSFPGQVYATSERRPRNIVLPDDAEVLSTEELEIRRVMES